MCRMNEYITLICQECFTDLNGADFSYIRSVIHRDLSLVWASQSQPQISSHALYERAITVDKSRCTSALILANLPQAPPPELAGEKRPKLDHWFISTKFAPSNSIKMRIPLRAKAVEATWGVALIMTIFKLTTAALINLVSLTGPRFKRTLVPTTPYSPWK